MPVSRNDVSDVIQRHGAWIIQQPGVAGCDNSDDKAGNPCLRVFSDGVTEDTRSEIKRKVDPVPVIFEETGPIEAYASNL